ncbi:hypothetical protein [Duganella sp. P38]|uniref:hypothetical protein n=1 Tax=Duganella sp. P38 TaxID=3423949 RepID=UPI003D7BAA1A
MQDMDGHTTSTDEMLQVLLERTAVMQTQMAVMQAQMQAQHEATLTALKLLQEGQKELWEAHKALAKQVETLREGQAELRGSVRVVEAEIKALNEKMTYYPSEGKVESIRVEIYKAIETQTWRMLIWMTGVSSATTAAAYYIARNVY